MKDEIGDEMDWGKVTMHKKRKQPRATRPLPKLDGICWVGMCGWRVDFAGEWIQVVWCWSAAKVSMMFLPGITYGDVRRLARLKLGQAAEVHGGCQMTAMV